MKLSELSATKKQYDAIQELRDERRDLGELLNALEDGSAAEVSCEGLYNAVELRAAARPSLHQAVYQSLQAVEGELQALGVELDEPAMGWDSDDEEDAA